jgi:hypothetical protein
LVVRISPTDDVAGNHNVADPLGSAVSKDISNTCSISLDGLSYRLDISEWFANTASYYHHEIGALLAFWLSFKKKYISRCLLGCT